MSARVMIIVALVVWLGVSVGCIISSPGGSSVADARDAARGGGVVQISRAERVTTLPFRGVAVQLHSPVLCDPKHPDGYYKCVDEIAALGADTVKFIVNAQMENGRTSRIYMDLRSTPTAEQIVELVKYARSKNLRVVFMPIVLIEYPEGMEWRGTIAPKNWDQWWDHYRQMMSHYAMTCERAGVDLLVIGSELVSTERYADQWLRVIQTVRTHFKGMITYSANWDHYQDIPFWDHMDVIGMNSYWKLGEDRNVPEAEVIRRWQGIQQNVLGFARGKGKPLVLLEVGWCSLANAAHEPWDYTQDQLPVDLELQARLWTAFFKAWHGKPGFGGFMVWEWVPGNGGPANKAYTPENKPAEKVIREWFAKPAWKVN